MKTSSESLYIAESDNRWAGKVRFADCFWCFSVFGSARTDEWQRAINLSKVFSRFVRIEEKQFFPLRFFALAEWLLRSWELGMVWEEGHWCDGFEMSFVDCWLKWFAFISLTKPSKSPKSLWLNLRIPLTNLSDLIYELTPKPRCDLTHKLAPH